jgi:hypothetical protein
MTNQVDHSFTGMLRRQTDFGLRLIGGVAVAGVITNLALNILGANPLTIAQVGIIFSGSVIPVASITAIVGAIYVSAVALNYAFS